MSGHSKWATIRRKKEKLDSARGREFSKLIKEITVAARMGGGDETGNPRLRTAVMIAKGANMPATNIERAIQKGTGELEGVTYEEITYEAYGPGGTALLIECVTDNRNRTVGEVRHMLTKNGGNMGETGSVNWMFSRLGSITVASENVDEDELMMTALEAGAEDVKLEEDEFQILTPIDSLENVRSAIEEGGYKISSAELAMLPQNFIKVEGSNAKQLVRLMEALDDHDDIQKVWSNFDLDFELLEDE
ncbi:YebC/PmpR family DNA-binding transcriptional regulator [Calditrichota bacterium]